MGVSNEHFKGLFLPLQVPISTNTSSRAIQIYHVKLQKIIISSESVYGAIFLNAFQELYDLLGFTFWLLILNTA